MSRGATPSSSASSAPANAGVTTLGDAVRAAAERLTAISDAPALEARWLAEHLFDLRTVDLVINGQRALDAAACAAYRAAVERRLGGEPLAYIIGRAGFWTLDLHVAPGVLVPRADTETLVEAVLARLPRDAELAVADLGTGSGAIALALAAERPRWTLTATDASAAALACARDNAARCGLTRVNIVAGRWFEALAAARFDAIVSNPPYVAAEDPHLRAPELTHEPREALVAGDDGLADLARLIAGAMDHLVPGGLLALEHGAAQAAAVRGLLERAGYVERATLRDLAGHARVTLGYAPLS